MVAIFDSKIVFELIVVGSFCLFLAYKGIWGIKVEDSLHFISGK